MDVSISDVRKEVETMDRINNCMTGDDCVGDIGRHSCDSREDQSLPRIKSRVDIDPTPQHNDVHSGFFDDLSTAPVKKSSQMQRRQSIAVDDLRMLVKCLDGKYENAGNSVPVSRSEQMSVPVTQSSQKPRRQSIAVGDIKMLVKCLDDKAEMTRRQSLAVDDVKMIVQCLDEHTEKSRRRQSLLENAIKHNRNMSESNLKRPRRASLSHFAPIKAISSNAEHVSDSVSVARKLLSEIDRQRKMTHVTIRMNGLSDGSGLSSNNHPDLQEMKADTLKQSRDNLTYSNDFDTHQHQLLVPCLERRRYSDTVLPTIHIQASNNSENTPRRLSMGSLFSRESSAERPPSSENQTRGNLLSSPGYRKRMQSISPEPRPSSCTTLPPVKTPRPESPRHGQCAHSDIDVNMHKDQLSMRQPRKSDDSRDSSPTWNDDNKRNFSGCMYTLHRNDGLGNLNHHSCEACQCTQHSHPTSPHQAGLRHASPSRHRQTSPISLSTTSSTRLDHNGSVSLHSSPTYVEHDDSTLRKICSTPTDQKCSCCLHHTHSSQARHNSPTRIQTTSPSRGGQPSPSYLQHKSPSRQDKHGSADQQSISATAEKGHTKMDGRALSRQKKDPGERFRDGSPCGKREAGPSINHAFSDKHRTEARVGAEYGGRRTEERIKLRNDHTLKLQKMLKSMEGQMTTQALLKLKQLREENNCQDV